MSFNVRLLGGVKAGRGSSALVLRLALTMIVAIFMAYGCTYSRWGYVSVEECVEGESWNLHPSIGGEDTIFNYGLTFEETDTTRFPRLRFEATDVIVTYRGQGEPITLVQETTYVYRGLHDRATNVFREVVFSFFHIPRSRPDTIRVDQDIVIFKRDTGEEVGQFHYQTVCTLQQYKYSRIAEFIEGT
jgi:hypothetical protein